MEDNPFNMIICGLGGQGVYSFTKVIWKLCELNQLKVQSSIFKGGAQKHGSIHSVLRIFGKDHDDYANYSTQIPEGELDLIIGMESWETLRYKIYFGKNTKIIMNSQTIPFHIERLDNYDNKNPVDVISRFYKETHIKDFTKESKNIFGTTKMVNYLIGIAAGKMKYISYNIDDYIVAFCDIIRPSEELKKKIDKYNSDL